ncbi:amidohydrolase family protein [Deinococcus sp.]|uniref:amidohydrolase family protein n=1 Tax=Deinococcus sp. TaxID=47478 RepID=UPI003C7E6804
MLTAIVNARIFDGEQVLSEQTLVLEDGFIVSVGGAVPANASASIIDAGGATLLPGLIDAHTHTAPPLLRQALLFGVTTELEMGGPKSASLRRLVAESDDMADLRWAGFGVTPPLGHPHELLVLIEDVFPPGVVEPSASTPDEARALVADNVRQGVDYIKIMIEEGTVMNHPGLPMLDNDTLLAAVQAAHDHGKLAIAHIHTAQAARQAIDAGMDGLAHVYIDQPPVAELICAVAASGAFVVPTLTLIATMMGNAGRTGNTGSRLAEDERVTSKLAAPWIDSLNTPMNTYTQGHFDDVLAVVGALHQAGVDILAGTDVSYPVSHLGGMAHGASLHHELQLLVAAGLTPTEALRSATSTPARRFNLNDRGRIAPGRRADLLLVDGDPTTTISDSLSIREVWRRGVRLTPQGAPPR